MRRSSLALRLITSSCAWWPEQHLGQAHGSVQLVLFLCKHRTLGGLAGTILLVLPPVHQVLSAATAVAAIVKGQVAREQENSPLHDIHQRVEQPPVTAKLTVGDVRSFFRRQEPLRAGEDVSTANALPAVGRWGCSPVFNSKVANHPNCCAVEQQLREPPTSTVAPPRSFPTKQRSDHSAWSSSAHRRRSRRTNRGTSSHRRYSEN